MTPGREVSRVLASVTGMPTRDDRRLAEAVAAALHGWTLQRDVPLGDAGDRAALLVEGGVAVHVATGWRTERGDVHQQLQRLAAHDEVAELVLVTTKASHMTLPDDVDGKPLHVQRVR